MTVPDVRWLIRDGLPVLQVRAAGVWRDVPTVVNPPLRQADAAPFFLSEQVQDYSQMVEGRVAAGEWPLARGRGTA